MRHILKSRAVIISLGVATAALAGCDTVKTNLLEAPDPDIIDPSAVQSAQGALSVRTGALGRLRLMTTGSGNAGSEGTWLLGGLLADEWSTTSTFVQNDEADERQITLSNSSVDGSLRAIYRVPTAANQAIGLLNKYRPTPTSDIAEVYFARGFAQLQLASDFCNGIPLSDGALATPALGKPLPVADVFTAAVASFDSAMTLSSGTDAASVAINRAARIGEARALMGLNKPALAAALVTVALVPTTYTYDVTNSLTSTNGIYAQGFSQRRYSIGDSIEANDRSDTVKNVIPFFSTHDPRLPVSYTVSTNGKDTTKSQDGITFSRTTTLWGQSSSISVVNGIDARLIEAEAALAAGSPSAMMTILNALRATPIQLVAPSPTATGTHPGLTTPVMGALTDPGTPDGRIDLLFREKAFWTFGRGQRLGDLRRLIRQYNRTPDKVFPVGKHYRGGTYGGDVNLPITTGEHNGNTNFNQCLDRNA